MNTSAIGNMNSVHAARLSDLIEEAVQLNHVLFVWGSFGLGKTEIVRQVLARMGYSLIDWYRGSQATPDTFAGVPYLVDGELRRAKPELLRAIEAERAAGRRPAVFLDELNLSSPSMLAAMLQFLLDRRLGEHAIGDDVPVIAAGNLSTDGSLVTSLPLPAANRMVHVHYLGPTASEWLDWAVKAGIHHSVQAFIKAEPRWLCGYDEVKDGLDEMGRVPTPRSWKFVSDVLHLHDRKQVDDIGLRMAAAASRVGDSAAAAMEATLQAASMIVPFDRVVGESNPPLPDIDNPAVPFLQQRYLLNRLREVCGQDGYDKHVDTAKRVLTYVQRMGDDAIAAFAHLAMEVGGPAFLAVARAGLTSGIVDNRLQVFSQMQRAINNYNL